jgi:hypothetical protein
MAAVTGTEKETRAPPYARMRSDPRERTRSSQRRDATGADSGAAT